MIMVEKTFTAASAPNPDDARRTRILEGAMTVFLAYGFQRTTMDDIARAADISRPALYLLFRNKSDIFRALAADFLRQMMSSARSVLAGDEPLSERLERTLFRMLDHMTEVEQSPHGAELLDIKNSLAGDILSACRTDFLGLVEAAVAREAQRSGARLGEKGITPAILAGMLLDAVDGMKMRTLPPERQREAVSRYIAIISEAISS